MARFYGDLQGNRGEATRMGTSSSGIQAHIRGWYAGIAVVCEAHDTAQGEVDICTAYETGGSSSSRYKRELGSVRYPPLENPKWNWEKDE